MFQESAKIIPKLPPYGEKISIKQHYCRSFFVIQGWIMGYLKPWRHRPLLGGFFAAMTVPTHASATHSKPLLLSSSMPQAAENYSPAFQRIPLCDENPRSWHPICGSCTCGFAHGPALRTSPLLAGMMPKIMIVWLASAAEIN